MKALKCITTTLCSALGVGVIVTAMLPSGTTMAGNTPSGQQTAIGQTEDKDILGSWYVRVITPDGGGWPTLNTFTPGGGLVISYNNVGPLPWLGSSAHGNWTRTARGTYLATDIGWIANRNTGELVFEYEVTFEIELNRERDQFTGRTADGLELVGKRIAIKPLP